MSILEDSSVYQLILDRGAIAELRKTLLRQGQNGLACQTKLRWQP
jgi:hypothetical protein